MQRSIVSNTKNEVPFRGIVRSVYKTMGRAIADYGMLSEGDRILVAVSGGLDSLSMLKLFQMRQARIPIDFEIIACFVRTNFIPVDTEAIIAHFESCNVPYTIKQIDIGDEQNCFWCSWNRRKMLFEAARERSCNKIAFGHNLDDITETILMNLCFLGEVSSCPPSLDIFDARVRIIRPLCYLEKKVIEEFARSFVFPVTQYDCPVGRSGRRQRMKETIQNLEKSCPYVKKNIFRGLRKIKEGYLV